MLHIHVHHTQLLPTDRISSLILCIIWKEIYNITLQVWMIMTSWRHLFPTSNCNIKTTVVSSLWQRRKISASCSLGKFKSHQPLEASLATKGNWRCLLFRLGLEIKNGRRSIGGDPTSLRNYHGHRSQEIEGGEVSYKVEIILSKEIIGKHLYCFFSIFRVGHL